MSCKVTPDQARRLGLIPRTVKSKSMRKTSGQVAAHVVQDYCFQKDYPHPVPEYQFAWPRKWAFDLAFVDQELAVEFQGGQWVKGRHNRGQGFADDCEKFSNAAVMGWRLILVTYDQLESGMLWMYLDTIFGVK